MNTQDDGRPIGDLLDGLSAADRRALTAAGFGMDRLRDLAATEPGARQVRHIVTEFGASPGRPAGRRLRLPRPGFVAVPDPPAKVAAHWALTLLVAGAGVVAVIAADVLADFALGFAVAGVCWVGLLFLLLSGPRTRGRELYVAAAGLASAALLGTALINAPLWYLASRGRPATATVAAPAHSWAHGARVTYCRVRLPGGRTERVQRNDSTCADAVGAAVRVVYDPAGRVPPVFGGTSSLGTVSRPVAGGAALLLVAAAAGAVAGSVRGGGKRTRGTR